MLVQLIHFLIFPGVHNLAGRLQEFLQVFSYRTLAPWLRGLFTCYRMSWLWASLGSKRPWLSWAFRGLGHSSGIDNSWRLPSDSIANTQLLPPVTSNVCQKQSAFLCKIVFSHEPHWATQNPLIMTLCWLKTASLLWRTIIHQAISSAPPRVARVPRRATATTSARRSSRYVRPQRWPEAAHQRCAQPLKNLRLDNWVPSGKHTKNIKKLWKITIFNGSYVCLPEGISHFETRQKSQVDHMSYIHLSISYIYIYSWLFMYILHFISMIFHVLWHIARSPWYTRWGSTFQGIIATRNHHLLVKSH